MVQSSITATLHPDPVKQRVNINRLARDTKRLAVLRVTPWRIAGVKYVGLPRFVELFVPARLFEGAQIAWRVVIIKLIWRRAAGSNASWGRGSNTSGGSDECESQ
jgi:hypothetical protein